MVDPQLLEILRCPHDHSQLSLADSHLVARVNEQIKAGRLIAVGGQAVQKIIDGGLVRAARDLMYPIVGGIPVMLADEAIDVSQFRNTNGAS